MRTFKIKVYFLKDILIQPEIILVKNDYNSVEFDFEFDIEDGKKVFELKKPDGTIWVKDIIDNKIVLVDYDEDNNVIPIINQAGPYEFEIVCYTEDSKITTEPGCFQALDEVVNIDEDELSKDSRITILDSLINETIEASKEASEKGDYAKSQGDYAKEQAESVISANNQATEIINEFKSDVDNYTTSFNENADSKFEEYNDNHQTKMSDYNENATSKKNEYNTNHTNKLKTYNDNDKDKTTAYNQNHDSKIESYNTNHDNKLETYNTNDIEKTNSYNSNHTSKMNAYNDNHTEKLGIYNSNHEEKMNSYNENHDIKMNEFNNEVDDIKSDLEDCYKNQIVGQVSGTSIYVDDSADARMRAIEIDGALEQETTKGISLIDFANPNTTNLANGTFLFENDTLEITNSSGIYPSVTYNILELAKKNLGKSLAFYYESWLAESENKKADVSLQINYNDSTPNSFPTLVNNNGGSYTFNIPENIDNISVLRLRIFSNNTNTDLSSHLKITKPMLYFGRATDEVEYEPYTGGQASPSPDYPQEIEVLEAPNLLPYPYTETTKTVNGITFTDNKDGTITLNGTATASAAFKLYGSDNINNQLPILGKYIFGGINSDIQIRILNHGVNGYTSLSISTGNQQEINLSTYQDGYIEIYIRANTVCDNVIIKPMLTKTNRIKNYIPYGCIETKVISKNLYNCLDIYKKDKSYSISEDNWVTFSYTNDTENIRYPSFYTNVFNQLKINTKYNVFLEVKNVNGDDNSNFHITSVNPYELGQFKEDFSATIGLLKNKNIINKLVTTTDDFKDSTNMLRSYITVYPGETCSITFRISILEDTSITPETFKYVPYQENSVNIDLKGNFVAKINDEIKDTIRIKNGHAILNKRVGVFSLNDVKENMFKSATISVDRYGIPKSVFNNLNVKEINENNSKCTHFTYLIGEKIGTYKTLTEAKQTYFDFAKSGTTTIDEFKSWLEENNVELYFELEEPYEVDLGSVKLPKTFKGTSNIFLNANLETNMHVDYVKDTQLTIDNLQSQIDNITALLSTTETSALLLDNLQSDLESEVI